MKYWRRHKHEFNRTEADAPPPPPPEKKVRYGKSDDILLAKFFVDKPSGTLDQIFQNFGRLVRLPSLCSRSNGLLINTLCSTIIILGKAGKSIIEYTKLKSTIW
jgi:hypothetical protein